MCKILVVPFHKNPEALAKLIKAIKPDLTRHDSHGLGFATVQANQLSVAKWLDPKDAYQMQPNEQPPIPEAKMIDRYFSGLPFSLKNAQAVIMHARFATTGDRTIVNTHPFTYIDNETTLIHNGIISNTEELTNLISQCDSETILNEYIQMNVSANPRNIDKVVEKLEGWFACSVITRDANNNWVVDVFKDGHTSLVVTNVPKLGGPVFCTSREILSDALKECKLKRGSMYEVPAWSITRFDVKSGKIVDFYKMQSRTKERSVYQWKEPSVSHYPSIVGNGDTEVVANEELVTEIKSRMKRDNDISCFQERGIRFKKTF